MASHRAEFKTRVARQLDALHARIAELEALARRSREHAISYDTEVGAARRRHQETLRRLHLLDARPDDDWHEQGADVRASVRDLERAVEQAEGSSR